jgi:hypothetical protein
MVSVGPPFCARPAGSSSGSVSFKAARAVEVARAVARDVVAFIGDGFAAAVVLLAAGEGSNL